MRYLKNVTYLNSHVSNLSKQGRLFDEDFLKLAKILKTKNYQSVYEYGCEFGQRLEYLHSLGIKVKGGVEFDVRFAIYQRERLNQKDWIIHYTNLPEWDCQKNKVVFSYKLLEHVSENARDLVLKKLCEAGDVVYIITDLVLDLPKEDGVYVVYNNLQLTKKEKTAEVNVENTDTQSGELD